MSQRGYFEHVSPEGAGPTERAKAAGFLGKGVAENIAAGAITPEEAVAGWMTSPGHCGNIMMPNYKTTGVGYAYNPSVRYQHYWTQMFGM